MKKFTKILLGVALSLIMALAGFTAFNSVFKAYGKTQLNVDGHGTISATSNGATVEHGTYAQPNLTTSSFTGVKLTGGTGATFNLGTIDISKSKWANSNKVTGYTKVTNGGEYNSFIDFVFHPTNKDNFTINNNVEGGELDYVDITVSQGDKSFTVRTAYYAYGSRYEFVCRAKADNQKYYGAFRDNAYLIANDESTVRKYHVTSVTATALGIKSGVVNARGASEVPISYYFSNNALFTSATYGVDDTGLGVAYLIRDFDSTGVKYNNDVLTDALGKKINETGASASCTVWNGFETTNLETGETLVNVSVTFGPVNNEKTSSIIVTKLGGVELTTESAEEETVTESNVISGVTAYSGSAKFGNFAQLSTGKTYAGVNLTGGVGDKFNLGVMSINNTYFDDSWSYVKGKQVYETFTDYNGAFYTGSDEAFTGSTAKSRSFISFALNPSVLSDFKIGESKEIFKVTLTEVGKPTNFVTYHVNLYYSSDDNRFELLITCTATNNYLNSAERYLSSGIVFNKPVRRVIDCNGAQPEEVKLYYDYSQQAAYTNVAYTGGADGITAAFRIRDFNDLTDPVTKNNYASGIPNTVNNWNGFSKDANVNITLEMTGLANSTAPNSVVLTSLGGYSFSSAELTTVSKLNVINSEETDLASALTVKTNVVEYAVNETVLENITFKVNGNDSSRYAVLSGGDKITAYESGKQVGGEVTVSVSTVKANIGINFGNYKVYRTGSLVEDNSFTIGDELRVYPGSEAVSKLLLSDVRELRFNGVNYYYNPENPNQNLPFTPVTTGEGKEKRVAYYSRVITDSDLVLNNQLNVDFVFDRYCDVTIVDTAKPVGERSETTYHWAVDGKFDFAMSTAFNGTEIARGSSTDKVLIGYARTDVGYKDDSGNFVNLREGDYNVADYKSLGSLVNYSSRGLGNIYYLRSEIGSNETVTSLVPGVVFETVYIKIWIDYELKLPSAYDLSHAGLRFVVKFDKADLDNYNKYNFNVKNGNPFGNIHNYLTTQGELDEGGKGITYDEIGSKHWLINSSWNSADTENKLGLINATNKTATEMNGKAGYVYQGFNPNEKVWHYSYDNENYYAYVITVKNLQTDVSEREYIFMPVVNIREVCGSATSTVVNAVKVSPQEIAVEKLNEVLSKTVLSVTYYTVKDQNGNVYYTTYSVEDINWLAKVAGDSREFT